MRSLLTVLALLLTAPLAAQDWQASPRYGTATLDAGFTPDPHPMDVVAGGTSENPIDGTGCVGYIAADRPDVNVDYTAGTFWNLGLYVESDSDTALLIRAPNGQWGCDDDSGDGLNPLFVIGDPPSGTYNVWVATFGEETADATLFVTEVAPDDDPSVEGAPNWQADPLYGDVVLQAGFTPDPNRTGVLAGGTSPNPIEGPGCVGYIAATQPDVNVTYSASSEWDLAMYVESDSDTALLIRAPNGDWYCNDDTNGLDPRIDFSMPMSGTYNVWVATFGESASDATLLITEDYRETAGPDYRAMPLSGRITLNSGFTPDPYLIPVTAGGPDRNPIEGPGCVGNIAAAQPDVVVDYTNRSNIFDLYFNVESETDTALLIRTPDGRWLCDDDGGEGLDPRVHVPDPTSGAYAVWVGTYGSRPDDAELHVSELDR